jgi:hypothetical protein
MTIQQLTITSRSYSSFTGKVNTHPLIPNVGMPKKYFLAIWLSVCDKMRGRKVKTMGDVGAL